MNEINTIHISLEMRNHFTDILISFNFSAEDAFLHKTVLMGYTPMELIFPIY